MENAVRHFAGRRGFFLRMAVLLWVCGPGRDAAVAEPGAESPSSAPSATVGAEAQGWALAFEDRFDRLELGTNWNLAEGEWHLEAGAINGRGTLWIAREFEGLQRLEALAVSEGPGDLSPILHAGGKGIEDGYFLQFGGYANTLNKPRRQGEFFAFDEQHRMDPGRLHELVAEFDGRHVRLAVDGVLVHEYREIEAPLLGKGHRRLGLYLDGTGRVESVRVFTRPFASSVASPQAPAPVAVAPGENLLRHGDGEDPESFIAWSGFTRRQTADVRSGIGAFLLDRIAMVTAPGVYPVDRAKTYAVSGYFKSGHPDQPSRVLLDLRLLTADGRPIGPWQTQPASGLGHVVRRAAAGATRLLVNAPDWTFGTLPVHVVFDAREDLADLPNFDTLPVQGHAPVEGAVELTLGGALTREIPAGTAVRLHRYRDYPRVYGAVPYEWTRFHFRVAAEPAPGAPPQDCLWPGAAKARIVILHQQTGYPKPLPEDQPSPILLFDDVAFREVVDAP